MSFYTKFEKICADKGVTLAQVREDTGISQSTMASWKSRDLTPRYDTVRKLSNYLGVTVDDLLTQKDQIESELQLAAVGFMKMEEDLAKRQQEEKIAVRKQIDEVVDKLNYIGQRKVLIYAEDILPKYRRPDVPPPVPEGRDTTPTAKPTEGP